MRPGARSRTAEATAALRAAHQLLDDRPRVLEDPYAYKLLAQRGPLSALFPQTRRAIERSLERSMRFGFVSHWPRRPLGVRRVRAQVVARSRYAEDRLAEAMSRGVHQYVVLGAGLDTFALRRPDLVGSLKIFEVDHPDTQAHKRAKIRDLDEPFPSHLELVACDFERQSLAEAFATSGFDCQRPAVFSWLGVSYYLSIEAIRQTLQFFSEQAEGSEMVIDYWSDAELDRADDRALFDTIRFSVSAHGEPMQSFLSESRVREEAEAFDLTVLEDLSAAATQKRYLEGRSDGLRIPEFARLVALGLG